MEEILDTLDYHGNIDKTYELASKGQRFTNYFIDFIGYMILSLIIGFVLGMILVYFGNISYLFEEEGTLKSKIIEWVLGLIILTGYYTIMEYFFKGKTLGKLITGTRAVTLENERMDLYTTFIRTICRFIPFEPFSFLGDKAEGWHDSLSKTKVIVDKGWND